MTDLQIITLALDLAEQDATAAQRLHDGLALLARREHSRRCEARQVANFHK